MRCEAVGVGGQPAEDLFEPAPLDTGRDVRQHAERLGRRRHLGRFDRARTRLVERDLELALEVGERLLGLLERDVASLHERLDIELADAATLGDRPVHQRLRVARVIALVVTMAAIADHVDHDVFVEPLAVTPTRAGRPERRPPGRRRSRGRSAPGPSSRHRSSRARTDSTRAPW